MLLTATKSAPRDESAYLAEIKYDGYRVLAEDQIGRSALRPRNGADEGLGYDIAFRGGKPKDRSAQSQYLVEGCRASGIGPGAARKLLAHFGSAHAVFAASPEALRAVSGVGPKTIASIREALEFDCRN